MPLLPDAGESQPVPDSSDPLVVRRHERHTCRLCASVSGSPDSAMRFVLARAAGNGTGVVPATVVDCSSGGIGLEVNYFFPRGAELLVRIDPAPGLEPGAWLEASGIVQRVTMISRAPMYYIGLAFKGVRAPAKPTVDRLLQWARSASAAPGSLAGTKLEAQRGRA